MGILGIMLGILCVVVMFFMWATDELNKKQTVWWLATFVIIALLIIWDASSPVKIEVDEVLTTDYERYGYEIDSNEIVSFRRIKKDPIRWGAVLRESTEYALVLDN